MVLPGTVTPPLVQKVSEPCPSWGGPGMYFQCIYSALALPLTPALASQGLLCCPLLQSMAAGKGSCTGVLGIARWELADFLPPPHFGLFPSPWQHPSLSSPLLRTLS